MSRYTNDCRHKKGVYERNQHRLMQVYDRPSVPPNSHKLKYLILNEEPKEYICEHGCVHKYSKLNEKRLEGVFPLSSSRQLELRKCTSPVKPISSDTSRILTLKHSSADRQYSSRESLPALKNRAYPISTSRNMAYGRTPSTEKNVVTRTDSTNTRYETFGRFTGTIKYNQQPSKNYGASSRKYATQPIPPLNRNSNEFAKPPISRKTSTVKNESSVRLIKESFETLKHPKQYPSSSFRPVSTTKIEQEKEKCSRKQSTTRAREQDYNRLQLSTTRSSSSKAKLVLGPDINRVQANASRDSAFMQSIGLGSDFSRYQVSLRDSSARSREDRRPEERKYNKNDNVFTRLYPYKDQIRSDYINGTKPSKMNWKSYQRLNVIHDFMDELETTFPSLCTSGTIGLSLQKRDIKFLKISNGNASNCAVWVDAGIHAREWIGPAVNTYIANHIARNFKNLPASCTNKDWYFLPVINPDGYEYTHTTERMWRKNMAQINGRYVGVDLNRNFSCAWGGKGSSDDPEHHFYRGTKPFSEPESTAMRDVLLGSRIPFKVYITLHSFGEVIIFPFAHREELCPDYIRLLHGATVMSRAIYETNGTTYKVGISKDVMYLASGTSNDWCYGEVGIPYCYLIELRSKKHKFKPPQEEIEETGNEILNCVIALMDFVDKYPLTQQIGDGKRKFPKTKVKIALNIWKEEPSTMDVLVTGPRVTQVSGMLHERGIPYSIAITDVGAAIDREQSPSDKSIKGLLRNGEFQIWPTLGTIQCSCSNACIGAPTIMDWDGYHRLDTIYLFMQNLAQEFPYLVTLYTIGKTVEGRKMIMMKISNGQPGNLGVWLDAAIHPREWIAPAVATFVANSIVRSFHQLPSSVTNKDWYILPVLNPDGYEYTHTFDRMWRKNRGRYGECIGVDLNRNFSYGWGVNGEEGSSEDPGNIFFRGPEPFSEPETAAVRNVIVNSDTVFKVFLSLHSYGEVIIFPWGYTSDPCPDYVELLEGGAAMAKAIHETSGRTYKVGSTKDLMYYAAGTSTDWSYGEAKIPFSYMLELRGKRHRFLLPKQEIISTATEVYQAILRLMDYTDRRCRGTQSCPCPK